MTRRTVRVLVVDDDRASRIGLARLLRSDGYAVDVAESGPTALGIVGKETPHVVVLDVNMPGMDGLELASRLRALDPTVPIIVAASLTSAAQREDVRRIGPHAYFTKPVDYDLLSETVHELTGSSSPRNSP